MSTNLDHFQSIERITRPSLSTEEAAFYLNRKPQTLRCWAMRENGLIRPLRINGRLAWPVKEI
ncbi:MAG TPA: DNA-binding protein, partial [Nitrosomonas sp.]|nr:DNA-binding protein [Nitrosomonas sp.]HNK88913.1 DNA-binding protein [Nitrosomonas sp.]HNO21285.1 DNA-binding protein [Nitrosomonas sp.]